ncbi:hypothetical protein GY45DRAFT_710076 [Cubamyces sp. BRFM 1775]|nr:hypothetical protein GY45DRAFT_710076 [Cubamyces sp. BRFM 1775]
MCAQWLIPRMITMDGLFGLHCSQGGGLEAGVLTIVGHEMGGSAEIVGMGEEKKRGGKECDRLVLSRSHRPPCLCKGCKGEMAGYSREDVSQLRELGIPERTARFALENKGGRLNDAAEYVRASCSLFIALNPNPSENIPEISPGGCRNGACDASLCLATLL